MAENQVPARYLKWDEEFLYLLAQMDGDIHRLVARDEQKDDGELSDAARKLIRYQTLIACGGYFGPRPGELCRLNWFTVLDKDEFKFRPSKKGKPRRIAINPNLKAMISRNHDWIKPMNPHYLILHRQDNPMEPVLTTQFNAAFKKYLKKFRIKLREVSSHTLRKTFVYHAWQIMGGDEKALVEVSKMVGHRSVEYTLDYIGVTWEKVKGVYLRF